MNSRQLLVSNPPHHEVDAAAAAPHFGLTSAEVRMKANYGLPEIWFAEEDVKKLEHTASALDSAGLNTVLVPGDDLVAVAEQIPAQSFTLTDDGLCAVVEDAEYTVPYDARVIAVDCRPRAELGEAQAPTRATASRYSSWKRRAGPLRSAEAYKPGLGSSPFLDLYWHSDTGPRRISIVQGVTGFPLLPSAPAQGLSTMRNLLAVCEARFEHIYVDQRLVDMTLRGISRVVTGTPGSGPTRTGFSYATEALAGLLGSLSPELKRASQPDLSSRLAYLTDRARIS